MLLYTTILYAVCVPYFYIFLYVIFVRISIDLSWCYIYVYIIHTICMFDIWYFGEKYQFKTLNNIHNMRQHASTNICMFIFWHSGKTRNTMKQIYLVCTFWYSGIRGQQWNKHDNNTISRYSGSIIRLTHCFQDPGMI